MFKIHQTIIEQYTVKQIVKILLLSHRSNEELDIECLEEVKDKDWKRWDTGRKNRKVKKSEAPFTQLSAAVDTEDLPGRVYTKMDVVNDVFIHSSSKPKYFVWNWDNEKGRTEVNEANASKLARYINDKTQNEKKNKDTVSVIECLEEAKDKDWKRWDTGKKNRKVKKNEAPFTELSAAIDIDDLPGRVYTKMDVINEVLKPPTNIVQPNPKPKYVAWDVDREERIKRADEAVARKLAFDLKDQKLNEKTHEGILSVNNFVNSERDIKCNNRAGIEGTEEVKQKGKDSGNDNKEKDNDEMATCGFMKLFRSFFRKSKK